MDSRFRTSITDTGSKTCGLRVVVACRRGNWRTCCTESEAFELKKEAFWTWLFQGSPEAADKCRLAKRVTALVIAEAKIWVWKEYGEYSIWWFL